MRPTSSRSALIIGLRFSRYSLAATRLLSALVGATMALALCGLFGLVSFIGHVGEQGQRSEFGTPREGACLQGQDRFDPIGLDQYTTILIAATCAHPPTPPGLPHFPSPGEVYVSPALAELRRADHRIAVRFPRVDGEVARSGLTGANELYAVVGVEPIEGALPVGISSFDRFGSHNDYLANYLRFSRRALLVVGLFFTLLPATYLIAACTQLNARTRQRQLSLLAIIGLDPRALRGALVCEAAVTVGSGALVGLAVALPILARLTPTFVAWKAFPGDFSPGVGALPLVFVLVVCMTIAASMLGARSLTRRGAPRPSSAPASTSMVWRSSFLVLGTTAAIVSFWWQSSAAWPLVLAGRLSTFVGLIVITPSVCARVGARLSVSEDPVTALVGARLRRPAGSLTRSLGALVSGLFVLSAGATSISALNSDPASIQQRYASDGYSVVEVRRPAEDVRLLLAKYDVLAGSDTSSDPQVAGSLSGSCATVRRAIGDSQLSCAEHTLFATTYDGQVPPRRSGATATALVGPRAEAFSGFIIHVAGPVSIAPDDDVFVPLRVSQANRMYDELVGRDPTCNVRIVGSADVSGASELGGILDVFRWGADFAVLVSLLAALISQVALLYDRRSGNNYLQILGVTRRQAAAAALAEVVSPAAAAVGLALLSSWLWALGLHNDQTGTSFVAVASPFLAALVVLTAFAGALTWGSFRRAGVSVVPDRDGLVAVYDTTHHA